MGDAVQPAKGRSHRAGVGLLCLISGVGLAGVVGLVSAGVMRHMKRRIPAAARKGQQEQQEATSKPKQPAPPQMTSLPAATAVTNQPDEPFQPPKVAATGGAAILARLRYGSFQCPSMHAQALMAPTLNALPIPSPNTFPVLQG